MHRLNFHESLQDLHISSMEASIESLYFDELALLAEKILKLLGCIFIKFPGYHIFWINLNFDSLKKQHDSANWGYYIYAHVFTDE